MDDKKKIILGSKDFISKGLDDIFINVNLQQTFNQIKKDKYDNNFDLAEQFRKERNNSRNFRIYGTIDSNIIHTDLYPLYIYKDSGLTQWVTTIDSTPLVYDEKNIFNKKRGKYLLELDNYDADSVFIKIFGNNITYGDQIFEQQLVYHTLDGDFVEYGTETVDIGLNNPGFLEIENNFPFFYNKHWIKKDIEILETKQTIMQFGSESSSVAESGVINFDIVMDKPSPFGNESVVLDAVLGTILPVDFSLSISGSPINFPQTLTWNQGEKNKTFTFDAINDDIIEFSETMQFKLSNFQFTTSGITIEHNATIEDVTPRNKTIYNFGEVYRNRLVFTGRTAQWNVTSAPTQASAFSILRNGLKFGMTNEEFYPGDNYEVIIINKGSDTLLPINEEFGITEEQLFLSNTYKLLHADTTYTGTNKHKIKLIFTSNTSNVGTLRINGVNIDTIGYLTFTHINLRVNDGVGDWFLQKNYEKDWIAVAEASSAITITSKTPGIPVKLDVIGNSSNFYIEEVDPFIEYTQIPKSLTLYANSGTTNSLYNIQISKNGYEGINIQESLKSASLTGENFYLISNLKNVSRAWDSTNNECLTTSAATPIIGGPWTDYPTGSREPYTGIQPNQTQPSYLWPVGNVYINGFILNSKNNLPNTLSNYSTYAPSDFYPSKLVIIPCTNDLMLNNSVKQKTKITIPGIGSGNGTMQTLLVNNANAYRSFDFRTGATGAFTTFSSNNSTFWQYSDMSWKNNVALLGGQFAINPNGLLGNVLDYGYPSTNLPTGPVKGFDVNNNPLTIYDNEQTFYLESKVAGVPFEITNIVNAYIVTSASNIYGQSVTAGDVLGPILVEEIVPNLIVGVDFNPVKNWMGGFNTTLELEPIPPASSSI